jgi:hypothetical protein
MTQDGRIARWLLTVLAIMLIAVMSTSGMFLTASLALLGPIAGLAAALGVRGRFDASLAAGVGLIAGTGVASVARFSSFGTWGPRMFVNAVVAAVVALAIGWTLDRAPGLARWAAAAAVALIVASGWWAASSLATLPLRPGLSRVQYFAKARALDPQSSDEDIYLAYVRHMAAGDPYYPAAVRVLADANTVHPLGPIRIDSPLSYRPPTLYWLLSRLPADGWSMIGAMLIAGSAAAVAGYVLARQYLVAPLALASAAGLTSLFATYSTVPGLLHAEIWAGALSLVAVTSFVLGRRRPGRAMTWMAAAASAALLAALVRELAAPVVVLGLALTLADADARRRWLWVPWAAALFAVSAGYAAHWTAAAAAFRASGLPVPTAKTDAGWWRPDGLGLYGGIDFFTRAMAWPAAVGWIAAALGLIGAVLGPRERLQRLMPAVLVGGGMAIVILLRPNGITSTGAPVGYWSEIYMPTMVACIPLALAWLPGARNAED